MELYNSKEHADISSWYWVKGVKFVRRQM